ncbi:GNAT family N-acetyltransferase [soil metagenome]
MLPAEVVTERLLLRLWEPGDAGELAEIYAQPEYLGTMPPANAAEQIAMWSRRWAVDGFAPWAACERETGRLIGRIGLLRHHDWPLVEDPVEVGWVLHRDYWGRGLATEGGRAGVHAWLGHLHDDTLYSFTQPQNIRSQAVMERLAMKRGGTTSWRGLEHVWYALAREEVG